MATATAHRENLKKIIVLVIKIVAISICLIFIAEHYFFEISPTAVSAEFITSFLILTALNWYTKAYKTKGYFKLAHIPLIFIPLFLAIHFRAGFYWASNTFPIKEADTILLNLQMPFDDFAYSMIRQYLTTTIPQALFISVILTFFLYIILNRTKKRLAAIAAYFLATIVLVLSEIPIQDYTTILFCNPEKNAGYSQFFVDNYVNPDSINIIPPEQKRNLILIYLESLETSFSDKEHGGNQKENLIPEITSLALQNINFGRKGKHIGGGIDINGSGATFSTMHTRTLGIPLVSNYRRTPIMHHYNSLYKILHDNGYRQFFSRVIPACTRISKISLQTKK